MTAAKMMILAVLLKENAGLKIQGCNVLIFLE